MLLSAAIGGFCNLQLWGGHHQLKDPRICRLIGKIMRPGTGYDAHSDHKAKKVDNEGAQPLQAGSLKRSDAQACVLEQSQLSADEAQDTLCCSLVLNGCVLASLNDPHR